MKTQEIAKSTSTGRLSINVDNSKFIKDYLLKKEIIKFVLNNLAGYENYTFCTQLSELEKLQWVLVHHERVERTNAYNEHSSHFMDIHFEQQNRYGRHLLVGRYAYESNPRKCYYVGFYFKVESIENGILYYSYISFDSKYQRMNDLKNAVAEYEQKNNCFASKTASNYIALSEKYFKN